MVATYEDDADTIYLVYSDTDLIPATQKAQQKGKKVVYIGIELCLSCNMQRYTNAHERYVTSIYPGTESKTSCLAPSSISIDHHGYIVYYVRALRSLRKDASSDDTSTRTEDR